ncbi:hypothetical protein ACJRO7_018467 [Eucalyptus globulus]|uniref:RING-type domain-containing protein n=1 Tax=Eucalyptus globulus TaxID=34317 RepID=A0ABD3L0G6_EUCGL
MLIRDDPSLPHAHMCVSYTIQSIHESTDRSPSSRIVDHYGEQRFQCPQFVSTDTETSPSSTSWRFISFTLDRLRLPFPLDRLRWVDPDGGELAAREDQARDEILSEILNVACRVANDPRNRGRKMFGVSVDVTKVVTLPEDEILREMVRRLKVAGLGRYVHEMLRRFEAASESAIGSVEKAVIAKRRDPSEVCAICLEEPEVGDEVSRMGCSHEFHSRCIEKWLEIADTCPTCRRQLPTLDKRG